MTTCPDQKLSEFSMQHPSISLKNTSFEEIELPDDMEFKIDSN